MALRKPLTQQVRLGPLSLPQVPAELSAALVPWCHALGRAVGAEGLQDQAWSVMDLVCQGGDVVLCDTAPWEGRWGQEESPSQNAPCPGTTLGMNHGWLWFSFSGALVQF